MSTTSLNVLHFADIHIGMENYGKTDPDTGLSSRVVDFLRRMDEMVDYALENKVELVIFAGDAFKTRNPNPTFQREFAWRMQDLAKTAAVVMLVGNHDLPPSSLKASSIEIYDTLRVKNVWVAHDYETRLVEIPDSDKKVIVGAAPYPIRSRLMRHLDATGKTIRETDDLLEDVLSETLQSLANDADKLDPDNTIPRLLTGHFTVRGAVQGSERSVMLGRDVQISLGLLADERWDYVALGHIHKHQNLTDGRLDAPPVVYSGSLERVDFGEQNDTKGFCWVTLGRASTEWEFVPVQARNMVTLSIDCRKVTNATRAILAEINKHDLDGAVVRLDVQMMPEADSSLAENTIREALRQANVFHLAGIRRQIERPDRSRFGANPEGLTPEELLDRYFQTRDVAPERRTQLLDAARDLMRTDE